MAAAQMHSGNYAEATEIFEASSKQVEWDIPVDGVLFELGKTYLLSGQSDQAQATFTRIITEFPESLFQTDAQAELDKLGSSENE
jgi:outer membrane protein assembly factor BamD (BamD/ComL family)